MRKIIKLYICLVTVLGTMTGYAQDIENGGAFPPNFGFNPIPTGYVNPYTPTGMNELTGVTITVPSSQSNTAAANAAQQAVAAANAANTAAQAAAANAAGIAAQQAAAQQAAAQATAGATAAQQAASSQTSTGNSPSSPPPSMDWYLDNDTDGWHSQITKANTSPGPKWTTTTKGIDCDDNNLNITVCVLEKKDCDTKAAQRGTDATKLLNSVSLQDPLKRFRDKANLAKNKKESGLSIEKKADGTFIPFNEQSGDTQNVIVKTSEAGRILVGGVHTHIEGMEDGPSPQDIYHLIGGYKTNSNFSTDFNIAENGNEYVLVVENSANLISFEKTFPQTINIDSITNNFLDTNISGTQSLKKTYDGLISLFYNQGFAVEDVHEMALASILDYLKTGLKILKKEKGITDFKELYVEYIKDANGKITGIKIKKCN